MSIKGNLETRVLKGIDLCVAPGEMLAVVGSSGSGKTTLLHLMGALDNPSSGAVLFKGQDIHHWDSKTQARFRNQELGFVYQFHHLLAEFTALENTAMPLLIAGESVASATDKATRMLGRVGLSHRLNHRPSELSGGERQRWPSPVPWSTSRAWCWRTSLPATWIMPAPPRCTNCSASSTASWAPPSWWSPMT